MVNVLLAVVGVTSLLVCSLGSAIVLGVAMSDDEDREQTLTGQRLISVGGLAFLAVVGTFVFRRLA